MEYVYESKASSGFTFSRGHRDNYDDGALAAPLASLMTTGCHCLCLPRDIQCVLQLPDTLEPLHSTFLSQ